MATAKDLASFPGAMPFSVTRTSRRPGNEATKNYQ